jgi:hypothetical protein
VSTYQKGQQVQSSLEASAEEQETIKGVGNRQGQQRNMEDNYFEIATEENGVADLILMSSEIHGGKPPFTTLSCELKQDGERGMRMHSG